MFFKLFTLPIKAVMKVGEIVQEEVDKELYDLNSITDRLIELETLYDLGEIEEAAYLEREEELLRLYEKAKERELDLLEESS